MYVKYYRLYDYSNDFSNMTDIYLFIVTTIYYRIVLSYNHFFIYLDYNIFYLQYLQLVITIET